MPAADSTLQGTRGDFPDVLSPLLVKELRQGLRSGIFVGVMVAVQLVAAGIVAFETVLRSLDTGNIVGAGAFWAFVGGTICLGLPLSLLNTLGDENDDRKIELLIISGQNERRVCLEKWLGAVARGALVLLSVAPYMLARYLLALVELPEMLLACGVILLIYSVICAIVIGASAARTPWLRGWMIVYQIGAAFACFGICGLAAAAASNLFRTGGIPNLWQTLIIGAFVCSVAVQLVVTALKYGADKIRVRQGPWAPQGVNGFAILVFAMPAIYAVIALGTYGFGVPLLALIIAWVAWTS